MQTVLIVTHLMIVIALVIVVLLQRSEGGALGVGGGSGFMTGRGQANVLTRATAILATLFFMTSLGLTVLANYGHGNKSILEGIQPGESNQQPAKLPPASSDSVLDQLRKIEQQRAGSGDASKGQAGAASPAPAPAPAKSAPTEPAGVSTKPANEVTGAKPDAPAKDTPAK